MEVILFLVKAVCGHKERRAYSCESWRASEAQPTNTTDTLADLNLQHRTEPQRNLQQGQPLTLFPFPKPHTSAEGPKCLCWTQSYLEDCYSPELHQCWFPSCSLPFQKHRFGRGISELILSSALPALSPPITQEQTSARGFACRRQHYTCPATTRCQFLNYTWKDISSEH